MQNVHCTMVQNQTVLRTVWQTVFSADLRLCIINLCCVLSAFSFITTDICIQRWVINPRGPNANYGPLRLIRKHAAKTFVWTAV
jgi:hypothetical protein